MHYRDSAQKISQERPQDSFFGAKPSFGAKNGGFGAILTAGLILATCISPADAGKMAAHSRIWFGTVTWVSDGDTLWIAPEQGGRPRKIRLDGIDAPELCQRWGKAARDAMRGRVLHRRVRIATRSLDNYRRELAKINVEGQDVGAWMVARGHAWSHRYRHNAGPYAAEQEAAARAGRGLFADSNARHPRQFRKEHGSCD